MFNSIRWHVYFYTLPPADTPGVTALSWGSAQLILGNQSEVDHKRFLLPLPSQDVHNQSDRPGRHSPLFTLVAHLSREMHAVEGEAFLGHISE